VPIACPQTNSSLHIIFRVYPLSKQVATRKTVFPDRELKIVVIWQVLLRENNPAGACYRSIAGPQRSFAMMKGARTHAARRLVNSQKPRFHIRKMAGRNHKFEMFKFFRF
jgi:hypothetical protein